MQAVDRTGSFRATITDYGLKEMPSGAVAINLIATLHEMWDTETSSWVPWAEYEMEAKGDVWIVKTNGQINQRAAESLIKYAGWDGSIEAIMEQKWQPSKCQVSVIEEEYDGVKKLKIDFVNDYDRTPGATSNVSAERGKELHNRLGGQFRALASNVRRNGAAPTSAPQAPPTRPSAPPEIPKESSASQPLSVPEQENAYEDIPF